MNIAGIQTFDIANGPGIRVSIFVSGCRNNCKGCFNKEAQSFDYGHQLNSDDLTQLFNALDNEYVEGLTILGGEPLEPENQNDVRYIIETVRNKFPEKNIWLFTGFVYENLMTSRAKTEHLQHILENIDVLVDGPFVLEKRDVTLKFRGSSNQRLIDIPKTIETGNVTLYE